MYSTGYRLTMSKLCTSSLPVDAPLCMVSNLCPALVWMTGSLALCIIWRHQKNKMSGWQSQICQSICIYFTPKKTISQYKYTDYTIKWSKTMEPHWVPHLLQLVLLFSRLRWFQQDPPPDHHSNGPNTTQEDFTYKWVLSHAVLVHANDVDYAGWTAWW